jgi:hypothetical protein
MPSLAAAVTFALLCSAGSAHAQRPLPDPLDTPGAVNLAVNQGNIGTTICAPGWTDTVRPPSRFTSALKLLQLSTWIAYAGGPPEAYEEDNLIPLELGGSPTDQRNLWPEPRQPPSGWGSDRKEGLERVLHRLVCDGRLPLAFAQRTIARDWIGAYRQFVLTSQRMR